MSLYRRALDWLTLPVVETAIYECTNCGITLDSEDTTCPECGGAVEEIKPDPTLAYWDPMM